MRMPPVVIAVEILAKKLCTEPSLSGSSAHMQAAVRTHAVEDDTLADCELPHADPARNTSYTAFVAGSIEHNASSLSRLLIVGRARDVA